MMQAKLTFKILLLMFLASVVLAVRIHHKTNVLIDSTLDSGVHTITASDPTDNTFLKLVNSAGVGTAELRVGSTGNFALDVPDGDIFFTPETAGDVLISTTALLGSNVRGDCDLGSDGANEFGSGWFTGSLTAGVDITAGGQVFAALGTEAAPSFSVAGSGMYSTGSGFLGFSVDDEGATLKMSLSPTALTLNTDINLALSGTGAITVGTLVLVPGSITDDDGTISFGNEVLSGSGNWSTTGTLAVGLSIPDDPFHVRGPNVGGSIAKFERGDGVRFLTIGITGTGLPVVLLTGGSGTSDLAFAPGGSEKVRFMTTGNVGINTESPDTKLQVVGDVKFGDDNTNYTSFDPCGVISQTGTATAQLNRLQLGSDTTYLAFYQDEGDLYSDDGRAYFGKGMNLVAERYGVGMQIREQALTKTLTYDIDATFTAATATILKVGETFVSDGVVIGDFLVITNANDTSYIGSTGEIVAVTETTIIVSLAAAGAATPDNLTDVDIVVFNHPIASILDNGDVHFWIGVSPDAIFAIHADDSNNEQAIHFDVTAGISGNTGLDITYDADTYSGTKALHINYDATAFAVATTVGTIVDVIVDNTGATEGDVHVIDVALSDPTNTDLEVEVIATHEGVDVIAQYLGDAAALDVAFSFENAAFTDRTAAFNDAGTDVQIFAADDDYIVLASLTKWDEINILLNIPASHSIIPTFHFIVEAGTWTAFGPADDSVGFSQNGTVRFDSDDLTGWVGKTINEITGAGDNAVDYYWIKITRTRNILPTPPTEDTIQVTTLGAKFYWGKEGAVFSNTIAVVDGIATPDAIVGQAIIYVDTADGDLKVRFGDGTVAVIATD